jgi:hypothetical protein
MKKTASISYKIISKKYCHLDASKQFTAQQLLFSSGSYLISLLGFIIILKD